MSATFDDVFGLPDLKVNGASEAAKDGVSYTVIDASYDGDVPDICPECGNKLYKHGARNIKVSDSPALGKPLKWTIHFPRKRCPKCGYIWQASVNAVNENHKVTTRAYTLIAQKSLESPFSNVANEFMLSNVTVASLFEDFITEMNNMLRFQTPTFLGIDEIKVKKIGEITVITDLEHRTLFDMLNGRNQATLTEYFMNMPGRENVLWVCTDMYRPFEKSIRDAMPKARWVIDHFHVVMKANEAVTDVRKQIQNTVSKKERIKTKKGLAYTVLTRAKSLSDEEAAKIRLCRNTDKYKPLATAFDLKEDFFNIYDENRDSKENAQKAFKNWEESIPEDEIYEKFRTLAKTVHNFYEQIFNWWDCPITISNGFTECSNRIIRENNLKGRGYSFEILRGRTLYRKTNLSMALAGATFVGPGIPKKGPVFRYEGFSMEDDDNDDFDPNDYDYDFDPITGEIFTDDEIDSEEVE